MLLLGKLARMHAMLRISDPIASFSRSIERLLPISIPLCSMTSWKRGVEKDMSIM